MQNQNNNPTFGPLIKSCRVNRGWTYRKAALEASRTGVTMTYNTIRQYEEQEHIPRLDKAAALARVYGISLDTLMGLEPL